MRDKEFWDSWGYDIDGENEQHKQHRRTMLKKSNIYV